MSAWTIAWEQSVRRRFNIIGQPWPHWSVARHGTRPNAANPSISNANPYSIVEGTLDECIRQFASKPISQQHLYEIHTALQGELITAVLPAKQIIELARLRDFL